MMTRKELKTKFPLLAVFCGSYPDNLCSETKLKKLKLLDKDSKEVAVFSSKKLGYYFLYQIDKENNDFLEVEKAQERDELKKSLPKNPQKTQMTKKDFEVCYSNPMQIKLF